MPFFALSLLDQLLGPVPGTRSPIECQMNNVDLRNGDPIYISRENHFDIVICSVSSHTLANLQPADTVPTSGIFIGRNNDTFLLSVVLDQVSNKTVIEISGHDRADQKNSARSFCFQVIITESGLHPIIDLNINFVCFGVSTATRMC